MRTHALRPRRLQVELLERRTLLATLPTGFTEAAVATGINSGTAMEIAPNGDLWVLQQGGLVKRFRPGSTTADVVGDISTLGMSSSGERGLLGIAFDPAYATNNQVYLYYTATTPVTHNRISSFTVNTDDATDYFLAGTSTTPIDAGSTGIPTQTIIFELDALSAATNHNGGAIHFGPDGKLYVAVGENASPNNAQTLANLHGKMLRINSDGTIPSDNPFFTTAMNSERAIWALGLRNPFTFAFQPGTGRMFINDVGQSAWEEINDGAAGSNYGWPQREGNTGTATIVGPGTYQPPFFAYPHGSGQIEGFAITGGAFYSPATQQFPSQYQNDYFFADVVSSWIGVIDLTSKVATRFASNASGVVDLRVSSDGSLYYLSRGSSAAFRIQHSASLAPNITQDPANATVSQNANATFTVAASGAAPLAYQWQRFVSSNWTNVTNGGRFSGATSATLAITGAQSADAGQYRAIVTNAHGNDTSAAATLSVSTNQQPSATISIDSGLIGGLFIAGRPVAFSATATDPEDGTLGANRFTWRVDYITSIDSGTPITRPFVADFSGTTASNFTPATTGPYTLADVAYRITLTVADSGGSSRTVTQDVFPNVATLTVDSLPRGVTVAIDGQPFATPTTIASVVGFLRELSAPTAFNNATTTYTFHSWTNDGARVQQIATPLAATTYTANYIAEGAPWQNQDPFDVDNDGFVAPIDALLIIIALNARGPHDLVPGVDPPTPFYDVSGDNAVTPLDAVLVINRLNAGASGEEPPPAPPPPPPANPFDDEDSSAEEWFAWWQFEDEEDL